MQELEQSPRNWPPLGLPTGSVRALLTLTVVAVVVSNLARGMDVDVLWVETLLVVLAHYFTSRRFVALPPHTVRRLEAEGILDRERQPLYLPRHSIRTIIVAAFVGLAIYLYREQRLMERQALSLLGIVFAYLLGAIVRSISGWLNQRRRGPPSRLWADGRAFVVLLVLAAVAVPEFLGLNDVFPPDFQKVALGLILFYFGSR